MSDVSNFAPESHSLGCIPIDPLSQFLFVQFSNGTTVLRLGVRAAQQRATTTLVEEIGGRSVPANLHCTKLRELPAVQGRRPDEVCKYSSKKPADEIYDIPDEADVHAHVSVHAGTV
jgi:hypothetical protein